MNYIYIDTKILGAVRQLIGYFVSGVFNIEQTVVYFKKYKHSWKKFQHLFSDANITATAFERYSEIKMQSGGIVFYLFNAQSNCRMVANRELLHVFVTHGESSKIASVKPIIRIYDYVVTAGEAGKQRYVEHKIFTPYDIKQGRLISMGDTFIGSTGLATQTANDVEKVILYAPTWEGGVPDENYSSLSYNETVGRSIRQLAEQLNISKVLIKPHPNIGHRLPVYKNHLFELIASLQEWNLTPILFERGAEWGFFDRIKIKRLKCQTTCSLTKFAALYGFCDISAIETQLLNEEIPYYQFCANAQHTWREAHHKHVIILLNNDDQADLVVRDKSYFHDLKTYLISETFDCSPMDKRLSILKKRIQHSAES